MKKSHIKNIVLSLSCFIAVPIFIEIIYFVSSFFDGGMYVPIEGTLLLASTSILGIFGFYFASRKIADQKLGWLRVSIATIGIIGVVVTLLYLGIGITIANGLYQACATHGACSM